MRGYVCTYRSPDPGQLDFDLTLAYAEATDNEDLRTFLRGYDASYWDWGDDPSFFAAARQLGDVACATWGVCRPDVRRQLSPGDLVVFFCTKQRGASWDYHFVGYGTVKACITRSQLWTSAGYARFRAFYNVLTRVRGSKREQYETFFPWHRDWKRRATAPYVVFDAGRSGFNVRNPLRVAEWTEGPREQWLTSKAAQQLEKLLFRDRGISRRLRTGSHFPHQKLNLAGGTRGALDLPSLRTALQRFVER